MRIDGLDLLALAMMDGHMVAKTIRPGTAMGVLCGTFGKIIPNLTLCLKTALVPLVRVHLGNGSGIRLNRLEPGMGEPHYTDFDILTDRAKGIESLKHEFPHITFYVSPFVEHGCNDQHVVNEWITIIKGHAPSCHPIISAVGGYVPHGVLVEKHGPAPHADIISGDGTSNYETGNSFHQWAGGGKTAAFFWDYWMNLNDGGTTFTYPTKRKLRPTDDDLNNAMNYMVGKQ